MIGNEKILSVITARGGSKGIPMKNVKPLLGKPLFMWSVLASLHSKYIDKTVISSNCPECRKIFENQKEELNKIGLAQWIQRPDELSGDFSKNEEALIHAMLMQEDIYEWTINLQPTSPCRFDLIDRCIEQCFKGGYDSLLTGEKTTPFLWKRENNKWIYVVDKNDCCNRKMRQEFKEEEFVYHDCGSVYLVRNEILLDKHCRIGNNPCVFEVNGVNSLQIDEEFDFYLIEQIIKYKNLNTLF